MTFLTLIIITSFICFGVFKSTRYQYNIIDETEQSEILGFIKKYGDNWLPTLITKPLYNCPSCMASFWSIMSATYFGIEVVTDIIPMIFSVCGLNYILLRLFPYSDD